MIRPLLAVTALTSALISPSVISAPASMPPTPREFRGVWVATVANIDWPSSRRLSADEQRQELIDILDNTARLRMNAVVFQVRPACDAFYRSELEPWSYYLTGEEGRDPGWDPLEFAVEEAHARGLELHAWFNPFRAKKGSYDHPANHVANRLSEVTYDYGESQQWLDPGSEEAQDHSYEVIMDVVHRYDIDAVHFDDYFYPYPVDDLPFPDDATYRAYRADGGQLDLEDWRRDNINRFIQRLYAGIHEEKPWVRFGLSPFGIWRPGNPEGVRGLDAYSALYADSRRWLNEGWVDYLAPQLYWPINSSGQPFGALLDWWLSQNTQGRHVWPGLFTSKAGDDWEASEVVNQVRLVEDRGQDPGTIHFSEIALRENRGGIADDLRNGPYAQDALVPASTWLDDQPPDPPRVSAERQGDRVALRWRAAGDERPWLWVVHVNQDGRWRHDVLPGRAGGCLLPEGATPDMVGVSAVDRLSNMSAATNARLDRLVGN